jgi:hypothetical protein
MAIDPQPPETQVLDAHHDRKRLALHTGMPGNVVSYDDATQTCSAQPVIILDDYEENEQPDVDVDVPVIWPGGGGYSLQFPLTNSDAVWLTYAENDFSAWRENSQVNAPTINRPHGMHSAAIPGILPRNAAPLSLVKELLKAVLAALQAVGEGSAASGTAAATALKLLPIVKAFDPDDYTGP